MENEVQGSTRISCTVTEAGSLTGCTVLSETPSGQGFGAAAVRMSREFRMRPQTRDGAPVGGATVVVPQRWSLTGG